MISTLVFAACFVASYLGVAAFRGWGEKRNLLDVPNERSSHVEPTPRGGGIAIVLVSLVTYTFAAYFVPQTFSWGYIAGALLVAMVSFIDDLYTITVKWRLLAHSAAAVLLITDRGWWHYLYVPSVGVTLDLHFAGAVLTFAWIVWLINAYNFMDGIDGIAGVQAVAAAVGWFIIGYLTNSAAAFYLGGALLFSSMGFLIHNWQPAKIFMGDVGSAFLGFSFASLPLLANTGNSTDDLLPVAGVMFVWLFVFDSVITFGRRALRREKVWRPHREHLYQRLVRSGLSHASVSSMYGVLALGISFAIIAVSAERISQIWMFGAAIAATLVLLAVYWSKRRLPVGAAEKHQTGI